MSKIDKNRNPNSLYGTPEYRDLLVRLFLEEKELEVKESRDLTEREKLELKLKNRLLESKAKFERIKANSHLGMPPLTNIYEIERDIFIPLEKKERPKMKSTIIREDHQKPIALECEKDTNVLGVIFVIGSSATILAILIMIYLFGVHSPFLTGFLLSMYFCFFIIFLMDIKYTWWINRVKGFFKSDDEDFV